MEIPAHTLGHLDTTRGSLLHWVFSRRLSQKAPGSWWSVYGFALGATTVPVFLAALVQLPSLFRIYDKVTLPFLHDWNLMFMFVVTMPTLAVYAVSDQATLSTAVARVIGEDIVAVSADSAVELRNDWQNYFRMVNIWTQLVGFVLILPLIWMTTAVFRNPAAGNWCMLNDRLTIAGYLAIGLTFVFYFEAVFYITRSVCTALYLRALVKASTINIVPFHPDRCGGLRPVGSLGLRNQYLLTVIGLNVVIFIAQFYPAAKLDAQLLALLAAVVMAYVVLGPVVFLAPLLPFREGMSDAKNNVMNDVAQRLGRELSRIRDKLTTGEITKADQELVARLREIGTFVEELPVWPFDAGTLRKFLTAYVVPLLGSALLPLAKGLFNALVG